MKLKIELIEASKDGKLKYVNNRDEALDFLSKYKLFATHPLSIYVKMYQSHYRSKPNIKGIKLEESINKMIELISIIHPVS